MFSVVHLKSKFDDLDLKQINKALYFIVNNDSNTISLVPVPVFNLLPILTRSMLTATVLLCCSYTDDETNSGGENPRSQGRAG